MINFISDATIFDLVLALIVQHSALKSNVGRADTLYNLCLDLIKDLLFA